MCFRALHAHSIMNKKQKETSFYRLLGRLILPDILQAVIVFDIFNSFHRSHSFCCRRSLLHCEQSIWQAEGKHKERS